VEAVKESNAAAIAATPRANIVDCLEKHYPLQGTAVIPPGVGGMGYYEEYDVMIRDGDYKRWKHMVGIVWKFRGFLLLNDMTGMACLGISR
jgi:hypothetical protein